MFRPFSNIDEDLEDIEYDHPDLTSRSHLDIVDLKEEVLSVYNQVITFTSNSLFDMLSYVPLETFQL